MYSRKRKLCDLDSLPSPPNTPQFSSTLNESLMENLEKFHLHNDNASRYLSKGIFGSITESDGSEQHISCNKISRNADLKCKSVPNTPEKQILNKGYSKKANTHSFFKNFSQFNVHTSSPPNKEYINILYPDLPSLESLKKSVTPQKIRDRLDKVAGPAKKCLFSSSKRESFRKMVSNAIIMRQILKHLSSGDLYRLSQVSTSFKDAILWDIDASERFMTYKKTYYTLKENYKITPPSSPEKDDQEVGSLSPSSRKHQEFWEMASKLNKNQHLIKCPMCSKAAVVENSIACCHSVNCGYIHCRKCNSFAYHPKEFKDKCNNIHSRSLLGDLSNATSGYITDTTGSFFSSPSIHWNASSKSDISGVFSECEYSTPKQNVKRKLSVSFADSAERKGEIFAINNRIVAPTQSGTSSRTPRRTSLVPPILADSSQERTENIELTSSPPRTRQYAACSKQSKRNLKRLTH